MSRNSTIEAYVLAGGKSSRMGKDKALMQFRGKRMIQHVLNAIAPLKIPIKIVANTDEYNKLGYEVFKDIVEAKGPMGGILTAMHHTQASYIIVISCDIPFLTTMLLRQLVEGIEDYNIIIPQSKGRLHPLCCIIKTSLKAEIEKRVGNNQLKMLELIQDTHSKIVNVDDSMSDREDLLYNINTPEEFEKFNKSNHV